MTQNGTIQEHYAFDKDLGKISRMWFSNLTDPRFGENQDIYIRNDGKTLSYPPQCIANKAGPYREMNYWSNLVDEFGGQNITHDDILFDQDFLVERIKFNCYGLYCS